MDRQEQPALFFACDAVVEEGDALTILSFSTTQAEHMRMSEFASNKWKLGETNRVPERVEDRESIFCTQP